MVTLISLTTLFVCLVLMAVGFMRPKPGTAMLAVIGLFSIGHLVLPGLFADRTPLAYVDPVDTALVATMCLVFLLAIAAGYAFFAKRLVGATPFQLPVLDTLAERYFWLGLIISGSVVLYFYATQNVTLYQAGSEREAALTERSVFLGVTSFFVGLMLSAIGLYLVLALERRNWIRLGAVAVILLVLLAILSTAGQRLVFITPIFVVLAALVARRRYRTAGLALASGVIALLLISPFAVALRSGVSDDTQDIEATNFTYGGSPIETVFQSVLDRADLFYNMVDLKAHTDNRGHVGSVYYWSVLSTPIPRAIYPAKPFQLSGNGEPSGEASILAWQLKKGGTNGSLTAFGAIVAYREGGWIWMIANGLLMGGLIALAGAVLARGGFIAQAFFCLAFVNWSVRKVPPSLFEALVDVMTYLPIVLALMLLEYGVRQFRERSVKAAYYAPTRDSDAGKATIPGV